MRSITHRSDGCATIEWMRWVWLPVLLGGCDIIFPLTEPSPVDAPIDGSSLNLPPACPMDPRLLACWEFENNALDPVGGNDLLERNTSYAQGIDGLALESTFGTRLDLAEPNLPATTLTIDAWVRTENLSDQLVIDHNARWAMGITASGALQCYDADGNFAVTTAPVPFQTWTHVACVNDGTSVIAYISGVQLGSLSPAAGIPSVATDLCVANDGPFDKNGEDFAFIGGIDRLRVWNAPLAREELLDAAGK